MSEVSQSVGEPTTVSRVRQRSGLPCCPSARVRTFWLSQLHVLNDVGAALHFAAADRKHHADTMASSAPFIARFVFPDAEFFVRTQWYVYARLGRCAAAARVYCLTDGQRAHAVPQTTPSQSSVSQNLSVRVVGYAGDGERGTEACPSVPRHHTYV